MAQFQVKSPLPRFLRATDSSGQPLGSGSLLLVYSAQCSYNGRCFSAIMAADSQPLLVQAIYSFKGTNNDEVSTVLLFVS